jgi:putative transposase
MMLAHQIRLDPTEAQEQYFRQAAGTARFVWNWALAQWNAEYAQGKKPSGMKLKKQFNATKYEQFPWLHEIHRDAHAQPFANLQRAWARYFSQKKSGKEAFAPVFKKKGVRDSFYLANDKFEMDGERIKLPKIGWVRLREPLRFVGRIVGASVRRIANAWYVSVQVDVPEEKAARERTGNSTVGVDFGIKAAATLSTGETVLAPKPLKNNLRRLRLHSRRHSRKDKGSKNRVKSAQKLASLHARITNVRRDFWHKLTCRLCCENQAVVIEDLNVQGMMQNDKLSRAIADVGMSEGRRQLEYKAKLYGTRLVIADRWYPSSKNCSVCSTKNETLTLSMRDWTCAHCGTHHDRDINAAINLRNLAESELERNAQAPT